jgi:hypothetical protein
VDGYAGAAGTFGWMTEAGRGERDRETESEPGGVDDTTHETGAC